MLADVRDKRGIASAGYGRRDPPHRYAEDEDESKPDVLRESHSFRPIQRRVPASSSRGNRSVGGIFRLRRRRDDPKFCFRKAGECDIVPRGGRLANHATVTRRPGANEASSRRRLGERLIHGGARVKGKRSRDGGQSEGDRRRRRRAAPTWTNIARDGGQNLLESADDRRRDPHDDARIPQSSGGASSSSRPGTAKSARAASSDRYGQFKNLVDTARPRHRGERARKAARCAHDLFAREEVVFRDHRGPVIHSA